jgi:hypothetical protein
MRLIEITIISYQQSPLFIFSVLIISLFGLATFSVIWLMFADPLRHRTKTTVVYFRDKLVFGVFILLSYGTVLGLYYPSLNPGLGRSTLEFYMSWPLWQQLVYAVAAWTYLATILSWTFYWVYCSRRTYRKLNKLSYMKTRYIQLSFRFFVMQATLIVIYLMAIFIICILFIVAQAVKNLRELESFTAVISFAMYINTLLYGRSLFLPMYCCCLAGLYLPAQMITERHSVASQLAVDKCFCQVVGDYAQQKQESQRVALSAALHIAASVNHF